MAALCGWNNGGGREVDDWVVDHKSLLGLLLGIDSMGLHQGFFNVHHECLFLLEGHVGVLS